MSRQRSIDFGLLLIMVGLYAFLGFVIKRHETFWLLGSYFSVFLIYIYAIFVRSNVSTDFWFYASILIRCMLLFSLPNLSDDFYRFIWDGRLLASGHHPFAEIPSYYLEHNISIRGINKELFEKLNSPEYFTVYPPLAQFMFWLSAKISPDSIHGSVIVMKFCILLSEIGSLLVIRKLLDQFKLPSSRVLLYALNPLVILELMGNIHLEAILIFFLLLSILLITQKKILLSGIALSMAICVKLIPLIFLPAFLPRTGWKKFFAFCATIGIVTGLLCLPLLNESIVYGFQNSLGYYFKKFEFNASIYYLVREGGYRIFGYNIIQVAGMLLGLVSGLIILWISLKDLRISTGIVSDFRFMLTLLFVMLTYSLFTTTLHPWYITTLFALSIFTEFRFVILWTAMIFLTYAGYSPGGFQENLWLVALEYLSVLGYLAYELLWGEKESRLQAC